MDLNPRINLKAKKRELIRFITTLTISSNFVSIDGLSYNRNTQYVRFVIWCHVFNSVYLLSTRWLLCGF